MDGFHCTIISGPPVQTCLLPPSMPELSYVKKMRMEISTDQVDKTGQVDQMLWYG